MYKYTPFTHVEMQKTAEFLAPFYNFMKNYHDYKVEGIEKINKDENYIFALNHSLATYDVFLFSAFVYFNTNIWPRLIIDNLVLKTPGLKNLFLKFGSMSGDIEMIKLSLINKESFSVLPGGTKEAIRSSKNKCSILWENEKEFIRLSVSTGTPIILAVCPQADNIYNIEESILTKLFYKFFKFPFIFAKGKSLWLPFLPKKVQLTHYIEGPFYPPQYTNKEDFIKKTDEFHAFICQKMTTFLQSKK